LLIHSSPRLRLKPEQFKRLNYSDYYKLKNTADHNEKPCLLQGFTMILCDQQQLFFRNYLIPDNAFNRLDLLYKLVTGIEVAISATSA
jgi:hypothetical protein